MIVLACGFFNIGTSFAESSEDENFFWDNISVEQSHYLYGIYYKVVGKKIDKDLNWLAELRKNYPFKGLGIYFESFEIKKGTELKAFAEIKKVIPESKSLGILQPGDGIISIAGVDLVQFKESRELLQSKIKELISGQDGKYKMLILRYNRVITVEVENTLVGHEEIKNIDQLIDRVKSLKQKYDLLPHPDTLKESEKVLWIDMKNIFDILEAAYILEVTDN